MQKRRSQHDTIQSRASEKVDSFVNFTMEHDFRPIAEIRVPSEPTQMHYATEDHRKLTEEDFYNPLFEIDTLHTRETPSYGNVKEIVLDSSKVKKYATESGESFGKKAKMVAEDVQMFTGIQPI